MPGPHTEPPPTHDPQSAGLTGTCVCTWCIQVDPRSKPVILHMDPNHSATSTPLRLAHYLTLSAIMYPRIVVSLSEGMRACQRKSGRENIHNGAWSPCNPFSNSPSHQDFRLTHTCALMSVKPLGPGLKSQSPIWDSAPYAWPLTTVLGGGPFQAWNYT